MSAPKARRNPFTKVYYTSGHADGPDHDTMWSEVLKIGAEIGATHVDIERFEPKNCDCPAHYTVKLVTDDGVGVCHSVYGNDCWHRHDRPSLDEIIDAAHLVRSNYVGRVAKDLLK
jgi:hypothetical protein